MAVSWAVREWRRVRVFMLGYCCSGLAAVAVQAGTHPRLLINPDDVQRLRHVCGTAAAPAEGGDWGRAGRRAREFQDLRTYFAERVGTDVFPGELSAAAFLHLVEPDDPLDARRLKLINTALREPLWIVADNFEKLLALDWCWPALDPEARREFLLTIRQRAVLLTPADSPLRHREFRDKLVTLAAALAIDRQDDPSPGWAKLRSGILAAAENYFEDTFPVYLQWRGRAPTSPESGPWEERDAALALELAAQLLGRDVWAEQRETVGRYLEHYVYASFAHPALQHHFIRDDGTSAPLSPAPRWYAMLPITAHLIAVRTRDPAAAFIARRVEQRLRGPAAEPLAVTWQWIPIVFDAADVAPCEFARLPAARDFGVAVTFRGRRGPTEIGIWIEAGQPFLRHGQHFDAGHFLIYAGGELTVGGGADVTLEAVPSKGGQQGLGHRKEEFSFDEYSSASIAHNCLILYDAVRVPRWYGRRYEPAGGQRPMENTCTDFTGELDGHVRQTGRRLAYGQRDSDAYLALDLKPAYDLRTVTTYTREFVFLASRVLVVIDRVATPHDRVKPVWVVNVPARPTIAGADLAPEVRIAGSDNQAGAWQYDGSQWLRWQDRDGVIWMRSLLPEPADLRVVGGPARKSVITDGSHAGRSYFGGDPDGFENLVRPVGCGNPQNAWYRLGEPTLLGPIFGQTPHWGRVEVEPARPDRVQVFVTVLVIEAGGDAGKPVATVTRSTSTIDVELNTGREVLALRLKAGVEIGGSVEFSKPPQPSWQLPTAVAPDAPLPTD